MGAGIDLLSRDVWREERGEEDGEEKKVETRRDVHARILCATGRLVEFSASQARGGDGVLVESGSRWRCRGRGANKNMGRKIFAMGLGAVALAAMVPGGTAFGQSASGQGAGVIVEQSKKVD